MDVLGQRINFPEAKKRTIGSLITREKTKGKSQPEISQVYVVSNSLGIVRSEDFHENEIHSEDTSNYTVIKKGMFAYNPSRLNIGSLGVLQYEEAGLVSPMYVVFSVDENIITKEYLHLQLKSSYVKNKIDSLKEEGARFRFDFDRWNKIEIPVPCIEQQNEIVTIMNKFSSLINKLEEEYALRNKQFEYYREKLYSNCPNEVKLSEIVDIYLGLTATPKYTDSGIKFISAQNTSGDFLDLDNVKYISNEDYEKASSNAKPKKGDLLFTRVGSNLGHPVIVETEEELCIFVSLGYLRIKDDNQIIVEYLKHWMNTELFWSQLRMKTYGAAKVNLNTGWLKDFTIPLPTIDEQKKIVEELSIFDKLCKDNDTGLPSEISLRKKQYEYYRDKLLAIECEED